MLTAERIRELFDYNPEDGTFTRKVTLTHNAKKGAVIKGCKGPNGYLLISVDDKRYYAHRLAWLLMTGSFPAKSSVIDHINMNRDDNRWENLREARQSENMRNTAASWSSSGFRGVSHTPNGKWRAYIKLDDRSVQIGVFDTIPEAVKARNEAVVKHFGEFGRVQ